MPTSIRIEPADIEKVAETLDCDFSDVHRQNALQSWKKMDIQACPGSGKTTLLVAKVAILSQKWKWRDRGVCVLSHTNVARREVEKGLINHPTAHTLLSYPHFIGTFQVFVDRFLALPLLRKYGIEHPIVDNNRYTERILQVFNWKRYSGAQTYFSRSFSREIDIEKRIAGLRFELIAGKLELGSAGGDLGLKSKDGKTYKQLKKLKKQMFIEGLFRYDEMYALAGFYLEQQPEILEAIRYRFPWIFIDEMQDTDVLQDDLITQICLKGSILQRFGDINQAIFQQSRAGKSQVSFPSPESLAVSQSMRFGQKIAATASKLTVDSQDIDGNLSRQDRPNTIFLFDAKSIPGVLPAFGELLTDTYPEGMPDDCKIKAVGFRKSPPDDENAKNEKIPYDIGDYWHSFQPDATPSSTQHHRLIGYVRGSRDILNRQDAMHESYNMLIDGVVRFLYQEEVSNDDGQRFTKTRLLDALKNLGERRYLDFQELLLDIVLQKLLDKDSWARSIESLLKILEPWIGTQLSDDAQEFLHWDDDLLTRNTEVNDIQVPSNLINVYRFETIRGTIDIDVTTIHAVKGETHLATLVLETYWHEHDLQELIPFLVDQGDRDNFKKVRTRKRAKRAFVGITRPKELLCLAIRKDHLDENQIEALQEFGWEIEDLTVSE